MSKVSHRQRKFLECTSRIRIHGHGRRLGAKNQDPNFGPGNRSLYRRTEDKRPIFKFSPRGLSFRVTPSFTREMAIFE